MRQTGHVAATGIGDRARPWRAGALAANSTVWVFWLSTAVVAVVAIARAAYLFTTPTQEQGDGALNSLLVLRAEHFEQLVGNYSRVGFHHPGPALLYLLAAGEGLFHGLLHVAAPYNAQELGAIVFSAALIGLTVLTIYRCTGSLPAAAVALGVVFLFAAHHAMLGNVWFPYLYLAPFLLFMVAGAALAAGRTVELPSYVLAAGLLAHGHVSFLMFVAVTTPAVLLCWALAHRSRLRAELRAHRRAGVGALGLLGLFALPIVAELALHYPGPWRSYWRYIQLPSRQHSPADVLRFAGWYWQHGVPVLFTVAAIVVAVALLVGERQRLFPYLYGMIALQSVLFLYYVKRGVDALTGVDRYVGFFYLTVPLLLVVTAGVQLTVRLEAALPRGRVVPLAGAAALVLVVLAAGAPQPRDHNVGQTNYQAVAARLADDPARDGRTVALDFKHDLWVQAAGIGIAAQRRHLGWCVSNPRWENLFTAEYVCQPRRAQWTLAVRAASDVPPGADVVWRDARIAVVERAPGAPLLPAQP